MMTKRSNNSPRVGIDLHVVDGKFQGSRTHCIQLFSRVIEITPEIDFFLYSNAPEALPSINSAFGLPNATKVQMNSHGSLKRVFWELPKLSRSAQLDIIHTQYVLPSPLRSSKRMVTIHDILFESHPAYFQRVFVARSQLFFRYAARNAEHIYTVSEFCKSEISERYKVAPERISVIYNGVDFEAFANISPEDRAILDKRGLTKQGYILSVGRLEPRKNQSRLIEAYTMLKGDKPPLLLIGQKDFGFEGILDSAGRQRKDVIILEDVPDKELGALYRNASAFVYPSLAEGFGMPVLEAMAAGVPVVTSNVTALPEITGNESALLVNPLSVEEISWAMEKILTDSAMAKKMAEAAQKRAKKFSWDTAAEVVKQRYLTAMGL